MSNKLGLFIKTYGCQMNVYDSIKMGDLLRPHGFNIVTNMDKANLVILNTCNIREKAAEKVYCELGRVRAAKEKHTKQGKQFVICVAGCVAQAEGEEVFRRAPFVDIVVGPQSYQNLPQLLEEVKREKKWVLDLDFQEDSKFDKLPEETTAQGPAAFLTIQEGCDKFCHFCSVPYTRGAEYSRPISEIIREAMRLAQLGAKDITLLGQNVSAYESIDHNRKKWRLGALLREIAQIKGITRVRYTTSHPTDIDEELLSAHRDIPAIMPYLHLPVQTGSDKMLKAMNRKHDRQLYFDIINRFKEASPNIAFSSDFIVAYPGETDQDFEDTLSLIRHVGFAQSYSFIYSPRPGTPGATLSNNISAETASTRLTTLQNLLREQQRTFNDSKVGETMEVLIEKPGKRPGQMVGKTIFLQTVNLDNCSSDMIGKTINVRITEATQNTLMGQIVDCIHT